jgi:hypothetical protein
MTMEMSTGETRRVLQGGCLCGAVRYFVASSVEKMIHCHCSMCRRSHGAAFATWGAAQKFGFRVVEDGSLKKYRSSPQVERAFCGNCGSRLFWTHDKDPDRVWVAMGTMEGEPLVRPQAHIFVASKAAWFDLTDDLPRRDQ